MTMPLLRSSVAAAGGASNLLLAGPLAVESTVTRLINCRASETKANTVECIAQLYGMPNDRSELFNVGGAAKTIVEQAGTGRVKVNDSHIWTVEHTHGVVTSAREMAEGLWCEILWSTAANSQAIRTKMLEGIVDEWSIEWRSIREDYEKIGDRYFRVVKEWQWVGLAICPHSAQGMPTTISVNSGAVPYADLPLAPAGTAWDAAAARERVVQWANGNQARARRALVWTEAGDGGIQIADVVDGRLVAVPQALIRAAHQLLDVEGAPEQVVQGRAVVDKYFERLRTEQNAAGLIAPWHFGAVDTLIAQIRLNNGAVPAEHVAEVTALIQTLSGALPTEARATLTAGQDAGPGALPPTSAEANSEDVQHRAARELELLELELSLLTK